MPRPYLAEALTEYLEETAYVVVEGPRGCGKTMGVVHALYGEQAGGVLRVRMTNKDDPCAAIAKALGMPTGFPFPPVCTRFGHGFGCRRLMHSATGAHRSGPTQP